MTFAETTPIYSGGRNPFRVYADDRHAAPCRLIYQFGRAAPAGSRLAIPNGDQDIGHIQHHKTRRLIGFCLVGTIAINFQYRAGLFAKTGKIFQAIF